MIDPTAHATASIEVASVTFAAFLVWASVLVQHLSNVARRGAGYVMSDRSVPPDMSGFFGRATRTLSNNIESALMYVPSTLLVIFNGGAGSLSGYVASTYILARLIFTASYLLNIPNVRSLAWLIGMICCAAMFYLDMATIGWSHTR
jgi:uncharacterized MAPEG superfamily protein